MQEPWDNKPEQIKREMSEISKFKLKFAKLHENRKSTHKISVFESLI